MKDLRSYTPSYYPKLSLILPQLSLILPQTLPHTTPNSPSYYPKLSLILQNIINLQFAGTSAADDGEYISFGKLFTSSISHEQTVLAWSWRSIIQILSLGQPLCDCTAYIPLQVRRSLGSFLKIKNILQKEKMVEFWAQFTDIVKIIKINDVLLRCILG